MSGTKTRLQIERVREKDRLRKRMKRREKDGKEENRRRANEALRMKKIEHQLLIDELKFFKEKALKYREKMKKMEKQIEEMMGEQQGETQTAEEEDEKEEHIKNMP